MKLTTIKKRLKGFGDVRSMQSNSGNDIANQFIIYFDNGTVFKSYNSIIAVRMDGKVYLTDHWDYSATTGKYRNQFLGEGIAETRRKIETKQYIEVEGY